MPMWDLFYVIIVIVIVVIIIIIIIIRRIQEFCQLNYSTLNHLPLCYMMLTIGMLHTISQIYLLARNKFIPIPRGLQ